MQGVSVNFEDQYIRLNFFSQLYIGEVICNKVVCKEFYVFPIFALLQLFVVQDMSAFHPVGVSELSTSLPGWSGGGRVHLCWVPGNTLCYHS